MFWQRRDRRSAPSAPRTVAQRVQLGPGEIPAAELGDWSATPHAAATVPVDRDAAFEEIRQRVRAGLVSGAFDDMTADVLDGVIRTMREGWDEAVDAEHRQQRRTEERLLNRQSGRFVEIQRRVTFLRNDLRATEARVEAWRGVLMGAPELVLDDTRPDVPLAQPYDALPLPHGTAGAALRPSTTTREER